VPQFVDQRLDELVSGLNVFRSTGRWLDFAYTSAT
jgi:hypothetical protein